MVKILKLKDFDSALGLASLSTKKLIRASVPGAKNSFPELLSKYKFSGTRDFNMGLIIIAFYNYCLRSDNAYIKKFAQGAARSGTISNQIFSSLAEGNGKEIKKCMSMQFEFALDAVLKEALPNDKDEPKRRKVITNFKTQAGKITPWVTNGNEIKFLIKVMFGSAFDDLKFKKKKKTSARDAEKLVNAAQTGDCETVLSLLKTGINVNARNNDGVTALIRAACNGRTEIVKLLLQQPNIDVNARESYGDTALWYAVEKGYTEVVNLLRDHGAHVDAKNSYDSDIMKFVRAAKTGDRKTVLSLLETGIDVNARDDSDNTALIWAARQGHTEIVKLLLQQPNIDVNVKGQNGNTTLNWAARYGHTELVKLLLDNGANVNARNNVGDTALIWAACNGHTEIVKLLLQQPNIDVNVKGNDGGTALMDAVEKGHTEVVKLLLDHGADVNVTWYGNTALMLAAKNGHTEVVELLLQQPNIDVNARNNVGDTALNWAAHKGHTKIVDLITGFMATHGQATQALANVITCKKIGNTAELAKKLVETGRDIDFNGRPYENSKDTLLAMCFKMGLFDVAEKIITRVKNLDIDLKDDVDNTALMLAILYKQPALADKILERFMYVDLNVQNKDGNTALMLALDKDYIDLAEKLISRGAKVDLKNKKGKTAIDLAKGKNIAGLEQNLLQQILKGIPQAEFQKYLETLPDEEVVCSACTETKKREEFAHVFDCKGEDGKPFYGHLMCKECIGEWIKRNQICPVCRAKLIG